MKSVCIALPLALLGAFPAHSGVVPLAWTVDTARGASFRAFDQWAGAEYELEATVMSAGRPLEIDGDVALYYQTNGMGRLYWKQPAAASNNVIRAAWLPSYEAGAGIYSGFLGAPGKVWNAAFKLRLRPSPGASPNAIALPAPRIDFAAVEVANAPWATDEGVEARIAAATDGLATAADLAGHVPARAETVGTDGLWTDATGVVWRVVREYGPWTHRADGEADVTWFWGEDANGETGWVGGAKVGGAVGMPTVRSKDPDAVSVAWGENYVSILSTRGVSATTAAVDRVSYESGLAAEVAGKADATAVYAKDEADARFYPADEGALWASWWSGDGFRVAVSNYDVAASSAAWDRLPSASFDYRPGGTCALVRVWSEITRWERHRAEAAAFSNAVERALAGKAGLDWGRTTPTGFDAPEGFTWLDTPAVAVAGGLAWQRTVTSEGAVWLLCSNGMVAEAGGATNGSFRVVDMATGEAAFEVVQGDRRTVGANCGEVYTWTAADGKTHLRVVYNVASDDPPVLHVAEALKPQGGTAWHDEGAEGCPAQFAGWTGSSGAWTNALWRASAPAAGAADALFCFATYETGGETVVKNHAPVSMSKIVVGGVTYALGTATVGGHTVLTLTEAQ